MTRAERRHSSPFATREKVGRLLAHRVGKGLLRSQNKGSLHVVTIGEKPFEDVGIRHRHRYLTPSHRID